jgi:hypothetical protein
MGMHEKAKLRMNREEELQQQCLALQKRLQQYELALRERDHKIEQLKHAVIQLRGRAPHHDEHEPAQTANSEPQPSPQPAEADAHDPPAEAIAPPQGSLPQVTTPTPFEPGRFLSAVLEGEEERDEMLELLGRLETAPEKEHFRIFESLTTLHRLMTQSMASRMDWEGLPREKRLFMRFGMLDESLMGDRLDLWHALAEEDSEPGDTGVYYLDEWLEAVASGEQHFSSIDEIALGGEKPDREATGAKALGYELQSVVQMQRMCVGPRGVKPTILMKAHCCPGPDNPIVTRAWMLEALDYVRKCDSLVFYRRYRGQDLTVPPVAIITPGYGLNGVCWEPFQPGLKGSTGPRISTCFCPPRASLRAVAEALAEYRWEYAKQDARQYWMTEGLTGDWLSLFKANEQKLDHKGLWIESYIQWVLKESQRIPTLERRFREFLWLKAPFSEEVKAHLRGSGVYLRLFELDDARKARAEEEAAEEA